MQGFLNINKPCGITSHDAVSIIRKITGIKQIGHAGTLDPAASGVLPIAIGKASKLIDYLPSDKRYTAELEFGKRSDTYDLEGSIEVLNCAPVSFEQISAALPHFTGEIKQLPPAYSAVHYKGRRLYELAREGKIPDDIPYRDVQVYSIKILDFNEELQTLKLDISCGRGVYIRSIVNDLGAALNTGAVMTSLIRTEAAGMKIDDAVNPACLNTAEAVEIRLIKPADVLPMPSFEITEAEFEILRRGNRIQNRFNTAGAVLTLFNGVAAVLASAEKNFIQPKKLLL